MAKRTITVTFTSDFADNHADDLKAWLYDTYTSESYEVTDTSVCQEQAAA